MNRRSLGFILLLFGLVLLVGAGIFGITGLRSTISSFKSIATLAGPGDLELVLPEADTYILWHDHVTSHKGASVNNPPALPAGYAFSLQNLDSGLRVPFQPGSANSTMTVNNRQSVGLGSFGVPAAGPHRLTATHPGGEERIFSLTRGGFARTFGSIGQMVLCTLIGFFGGLLAIAGVILLLLGRKKSTAPPLPTA